MPATFTETGVTEFVVGTCFKCGVKFAMTTELYRTCRRLGPQQTFYCPNGHGQVYRNSNDPELDRQRQRAEQAERDAAALRAQLDQLREHAKTMERRHAAAKGAATRIRNRVKHGVCPCCNKQFTDLRDHMRSEHPSFVPSDVE